MAVAIAEVMAMRVSGRKRATVRPRSERVCPICEMAGDEVSMVPHKPLPHHHWCATCGHVEINWRPIYRRVKDMLEEYTFALVRTKQEPASAIAKYGPALAAGGESSSQQEAYIIRHQADVKLVSWVRGVLQGPHLNEEDREIIRLRYIERWSVRKAAMRLNMQEPTLYEHERRLLRVIARAKGWA